MQIKVEKYKRDLGRLIKEGRHLLSSLIFEFSKGDKLKKEQREIIISSFHESYQIWYSEAMECVKQLLPSRLDDFISFYKPTATKRKRDELSHENYTISDFLVRSSVNLLKSRFNYNNDEFLVAISKFDQQLRIIKSLKKKFKSSLFDIKQLVQADLFDSELDASEELNNKGFTRAAGAVAGVVLERHLSQLCEKYNLKVTKKNPTINDFNQLLKDNDIIDIPTWRFIQHLTDLRNICDHNKKREPKKEEVEELINGVKKITKTLF